MYINTINERAVIIQAKVTKNKKKTSERYSNA